MQSKHFNMEGLPLDVYRYILSFGSVQIRYNFKMVMQQIDDDTALRNTLLQGFHDGDYQDINFDKAKLFQFVKKCCCCLRHMKNRPVSYDEAYVDYPKTTHDHLHLDCGCPCRHLLRKLIDK